MSYSRAKHHDAPYVGPRWYVAAAWLALAIVAQATVVHRLAVHDVVPSVVLVAVVWYAVRVDVGRAAIYGLAAGLCEDLLAVHTGGAWTIATTLVAILAGTLSRGFFADSIPLLVAITAVATLVRAALFWITMAFEGYPAGIGALHFHEALLQTCFNVVVMLVVAAVARRFERRA